MVRNGNNRRTGTTTTGALSRRRPEPDPPDPTRGRQAGRQAAVHVLEPPAMGVVQARPGQATILAGELVVTDWRPHRHRPARPRWLSTIYYLQLDLSLERLAVTYTVEHPAIYIIYPRPPVSFFSRMKEKRERVHIRERASFASGAPPILASGDHGLYCFVCTIIKKLAMGGKHH